MNLSQLEVLVAIVETGSLTEAAETVGLTQSAVSYSLKKLEAELSVTLLQRGRQGVTVTRIGEEVVPHARSIMGQVEIIRQKLARLHSEHRDLDDVIAQITGTGSFDQLQIQRLKKRKLMLKDQILQLESELLPDIIA